MLTLYPLDYIYVNMNIIYDRKSSASRRSQKRLLFFLEHAQKRLLDVYWQAIRFATWYKTLAVNNLFGKQLQGIRLLLSIIRSQKIPLDCIYLFHGQPSFWKKKIARNLSTLKSYLHHSWVLLKKQLIDVAFFSLWNVLLAIDAHDSVLGSCLLM